MSNKMVFFKRSYDRNGNIVVDGAVKLFLKPDYSTKQLAVIRSVDGQNGPRTVCNLQGDVKIDEFLAKQIKYFFGADLTVGDFMNIRVGVWGHMGDVIGKFNLAEKDLYIFFISDAKLSSFNRQNGQVGFQLSCSAYDFEKLHSAKPNGENGNQQQYQQPAQPAQQYAPQQPAPQQYQPQRPVQSAPQQFAPQQPAPQQYQPQRPVQSAPQQFAPQQPAQQPVQQYQPQPAQQYQPQRPAQSAPQQFAPQQPAQQPVQQYQPQPAQQYAPQNAPQQNMTDDFAAIEESEDLPF